MILFKDASYPMADFAKYQAEWGKEPHSIAPCRSSSMPHVMTFASPPARRASVWAAKPYGQNNSGYQNSLDQHRASAPSMSTELASMGVASKPNRHPRR